ncbi:hypothetical protein HNP84_007358 [Thermocatellispora tengchongensis]|uniref:Uncharacterized protein n=1 Tax=Thermocatellispora tengchongensis TaxID=1073253 RepID=A0A840PFQ4_9ACTN|nr:hypothetical protein [Thermocatellispora tengchongensis]MBB5137606.1 hypothetical protein [Thermocatellispora tengchongensis]
MSVPHIYDNTEGAQRISNDLKVIRPSTLARLARTGAVPHVRNGRKVGWTDEHLAAVVQHLSQGAGKRAKKPDSAKRKQETPDASRAGNIAPFEIRRGSRYGRND